MYIVNLDKSGQVAVGDVDIVTDSGKESLQVIKKKRKLFASPQKIVTPKKNLSLMIEEAAIKGLIFPAKKIIANLSIIFFLVKKMFLGRKKI